jgi:Mn-dependent DtxR family transcriptional regulator
MEVFIDFVKNLSVQYIIWQCEKKNYIENTGDGKYRLTEIGQKKILNR